MTTKAVVPVDMLDIPWSKEAEEAVIGAVLVSGNLFPLLQAFLYPRHFFLVRHRFVWQAFVALAARGEAIDMMSVATQLQDTDREEFKNIGAFAEMIRLTQCCQDSYHAETYGKQVHRLAIRREMLEAADALREAALDPSERTEIAINRLDRKAVDLRRELTQVDAPIRHMEQATFSKMEEYFERRKRHKENPNYIIGVRTGIHDLDRLLDGLRPGSITTLAGSTGAGKCLGKGTPVMMFDGTVKAVEDIQAGELLMGPDSAPRRVLSTTRGYSPLYRVTPTKGDAYVVNDVHILSLRMNCDVTPYKKGQIVNLSIEDYFSQTKTFRHCAKGWRASLDFEECPVALDPYLFGLWLGDGTAAKPSITTPDFEVVQTIEGYATQHNLSLRIERKPDAGCQTYTFSAGPRWSGRSNAFLDSLKRYGLIRNKHIPQDYKLNSRSVRLALLAGIIDADGHLSNGCYELCCKETQLADDYLWLIRSLGFAAYKTHVRKGIKSTGFSDMYWRLCISGDISQIPCRVARRVASARKMNKDTTNVGIRVDPCGEGEYFGFEIDGDHLFLLGDFTVTHNTALTLQIARFAAQKGILRAAASPAKVHFFSGEMTEAQLMDRLVSGVTGIPVRHLERGSFDDTQQEQIVDAMHDLDQTTMLTFEGGARMNTAQIRQRVRTLTMDNCLDLLVLDGLLQIEATKEDARAKAQRRDLIEDIMNDLEDIAISYNVPILMTHQLSRALAGRQNKRPILSDLAEASFVEQKSAVILFLYREGYYDPNAANPNAAEIIVEKNRHGSTGTIYTEFDRQFTRFLEANKGAYPQGGRP